MEHIIKLLESHRIRTNSAARAIADLGDDIPADVAYELDTSNTASLSWKMRQIYIKYALTEIINAHLSKRSVTLVDVETAAMQKTEDLIRRAPYLLAADETNAAPLTVETATVAMQTGDKPKKGAKKVLAEAIFKEMMAAGSDRASIIKAFEEKLDMSKSGATTYFYMCSKA